MLTSLGFIFLVGLLMANICQKVKLPRIIGMLFTGIILGPFALNLFDSSILGISADLRQMALIVILIKAGLSLDISDLKRVGRPSVMMSFVPACFEISAFVIFAPLIMGVSRLDSAIMGAVLGAVSPAIVVPRMVYLIENKIGTEQSIPQMILAGASLDDVFVIVMFTTFIGMANGDRISIANFANIPISIILGILIGGIVGVVISAIFEKSHSKNKSIRNSVKVIIILGSAFILIAIENWLKSVISISGLIAVMSMASGIKFRCRKQISQDLSDKYGKLWLGTELILFVLVGSAVDVTYTLSAGVSAIFMIFIGLIFRSIGVLCCLIGTKLTIKEKLFCVISYLPKATVQAAIGSVPLSLGLPCGKTVLSVAVLAILITAPLGAFGIDSSYDKLLKKQV